MKKYNKFGYAGAMLLAGLVSFSACSSDDELADVVNPNVEGEAVKTQFALNIPRAGKSGRMTADNTQNNNSNFLGMSDIRMYEFPTAAPVKGTTEYDFNRNSPITLTAIANDGFNNNSNLGTLGVKVYTNIEMTPGSKAVLFYAEERNAYTNRVGAGAVADNFAHGVIVPNVNVPAQSGGTIGKVQDLTFNLQPITTHTTKSVGTKGTALLQFLNDLEDMTSGSLAWSTCAAAQGEMQKDLEKAYKGFIRTTAGSSASVLQVLQALYNTMQGFITTYNIESSTDEYKLAQAIINKIKTVCTAGGPDPHGQYTLSYTGGENSTVAPFPGAELATAGEMYIPDGAIQLKYTGGAFAYATTPDTNNPMGQQVAEWNTYVYPASLYYMANTPLLVSNEGNKLDNAANVTDWKTIIDKYNGAEASNGVTYDTKSAILQDKINYSVGVLETHVKTASSTILDAMGQTVNVSASTFKLTGVLVGEQKSVDWDFVPAGGETYTVYDKDITHDMFAKVDDGQSQANYTMVMPTTKSTATVNVALEFTNGDTPFYGKGKGLIPAGGKFYLIGKLSLSNSPSTGVATVKDQVFAKDHKTKATFTIGENSLEHAYNVIPDLRTTRLEFGMSVDLTWIEGLDFKDVPLGQ